MGLLSEKIQRQLNAKKYKINAKGAKNTAFFFAGFALHFALFSRLSRSKNAFNFKMHYAYRLPIILSLHRRNTGKSHARSLRSYS
jgi:hypothetical protein